jgi:hypothetical protein
MALHGVWIDARLGLQNINARGALLILRFGFCGYGMRVEFKVKCEKSKKYYPAD